jgi:outer membrane protein assembly factor BamB
MKLDTSGNKIWHTNFSGSDPTTGLDRARSIVYESGLLYLGGQGYKLAEGSTTQNGWVMKLNATTGNKIWDTNFSSGAFPSDAKSLAYDANNLYVAGYGYRSFSSSSYFDGQITKLSCS